MENICKTSAYIWSVCPSCSSISPSYLKGNIGGEENLHTSKKFNFIDPGMPNFSQKPPIFEKFRFLKFFLTSQLVVLTYFGRSFDCLFRRFSCLGLTLVVVFSVFRQVSPQTGPKTEKTTSKVRLDMKIYEKDSQNYDQSTSKLRARR